MEALGVKDKAIDTEDTTLVKAFQAGDKGAFDKLVLKYKDRTFNMCYRFLWDHDEANDSAQDVFLKAYKSLPGFRQESTFSTWLYRITVNTCKNKLKSLSYRFRHRMISLRNRDDNETHYIPEVEDPSESPMERLDRKQTEASIQEAINTLPLSQKTVIILRHIEGLSYEEIARVTGSNLGTVKSKIARARLRLKDSLKDII